MRYYHRAILSLAVLEQIVVSLCASCCDDNSDVVSDAIFPSACHDRDTEWGGWQQRRRQQQRAGVEGCGRLAVRKGRDRELERGQRGDLERQHPELSIGWEELSIHVGSEVIKKASAATKTPPKMCTMTMMLPAELLPSYYAVHVMH